MIIWHYDGDAELYVETMQEKHFEMNYFAAANDIRY